MLAIQYSIRGKRRNKRTPLALAKKNRKETRILSMYCVMCDEEQGGTGRFHSIHEMLGGFTYCIYWFPPL